MNISRITFPPSRRPVSLFVRSLAVIGLLTGIGGVAFASSITFTTIDDPLATAGTGAGGINDAGQIAGYYAVGSAYYGFVTNGGAFSTLGDPLAPNLTVANGINDAGGIVGRYNTSGSTSGIHGFLDSGGVFSTIDDPLATAGTLALAINASGLIVGYITTV